MKKRIVALCLVLGMVVGVTACGPSTSKIATITLEGKEYELSGDFQEVVGSMVENDLQVVSLYSSGLTSHIFDEDGKISENELDKEEPHIYALERAVLFETEDEDLGSFIHKVYCLDANVEFESKLGFDSDSDKKDMKEIDGFMKTTPIRMMNSDAYVAIYVDGKAVDIAGYEEDFEDWKDMLDEEGYAKAHEEFFTGTEYIKIVCRMFNADFLKMCNTYDELKMRLEGTIILLEEEVLLAFAMQDACELLEDGDAEKVVVVKVEVTDEDDVIMEYNEFYFDEDWDSEKFKNN